MITLAECVSAAAADADFVREFDRLTGHNLARRGSAIGLMVDDSSGRTDAACAEFIALVFRAIYSPIADNTDAKGAG